ncbi:O-antigen ligase family protein [Pseudomonas sp. MS19]|uniref:O-antigen ligase family protein n=1 Tax=Pseudomonas sp. MS19 TaxID=2579939 RepID=UPI0031F6E31A
MRFSARLFSFLFLCYLIFCVVSPSGSIFGVSIRQGLFLAVVVSCIFDIACNRKAQISWMLAGFFICLCLMFWALIGLVNGYPDYSVFGELSDVLATFSTVYFGVYAYRSAGLTLARVSNVIVNSALLFGLAKVIVFILLYLHVATYSQFIDWHQSIFGLLPITLIAGDFVRINNVNDFVFPLVLLYYFVGGWRRGSWFGLCVIVFALIVSYSRYLWFYSFVLFLSYFFFRAEFTTRIVGVFCLFMIVLCLLFVDAAFVISFIVERYSGEKAGVSDTIRLDMYPVLVEMVNDNVLFGNGFGAYSKAYYRFELNPWLYELQWLSWVKDVGVIGLFLTLTLLYRLYRFNSLFRGSVGRSEFVWYVAMIMWLAVGLVNCFLLGPTAGVVFYFLWIIRYLFCFNDTEAQLCPVR